MSEQIYIPGTASLGNGTNYDRPRPSDGQVPLFNGVIPPPAPINYMRTVSIRQLDHGYIVEVGCQAFAIENATSLIAKLSEYILAPQETEQKWVEGKLF